MNRIRSKMWPQMTSDQCLHPFLNALIPFGGLLIWLLFSFYKHLTYFFKFFWTKTKTNFRILIFWCSRKFWPKFFHQNFIDILIGDFSPTPIRQRFEKSCDIFCESDRSWLGRKNSGTFHFRWLTISYSL